MRVKAETEGKTKDVGLLDVTPESFIVPKGEESFYHCRIEVVKFNQETGERISRPRMQVFGKKFFETFGCSICEKWVIKLTLCTTRTFGRQRTKKRLKPANEQRQKQQQRRQQKQRRQNVNKKAEIIAELTAAGIIPAEPKKAGRKPKAEKTAEAEEAAGDSPENNENV